MNRVRVATVVRTLLREWMMENSLYRCINRTQNLITSRRSGKESSHLFLSVSCVRGSHSTPLSCGYRMLSAADWLMMATPGGPSRYSSSIYLWYGNLGIFDIRAFNHAWLERLSVCLLIQPASLLV